MAFRSVHPVIIRSSIVRKCNYNRSSFQHNANKIIDNAFYGHESLKVGLGDSPLKIQLHFLISARDDDNYS